MGDEFPTTLIFHLFSYNLKKKKVLFIYLFLLLVIIDLLITPESFVSAMNCSPLSDFSSNVIAE